MRARMAVVNAFFWRGRLRMMRPHAPSREISRSGPFGKIVDMVRGLAPRCSSRGRSTACSTGRKLNDEMSSQPQFGTRYDRLMSAYSSFDSLGVFGGLALGQGVGDRGARRDAWQVFAGRRVVSDAGAGRAGTGTRGGRWRLDHPVEERPQGGAGARARGRARSGRAGDAHRAGGAGPRLVGAGHSAGPGALRRAAQGPR